VVGHLQHSCWFMYCMTGVLLGLDRYIELKWPNLGKRLFSGNRTWYWLSLPLLYGISGSSAIDLPPIYNSVWSSFLFQIDLSEGAPTVTDWYCFANSICTLVALVVIYSLLFLELRRKSVSLMTPGTGDSAHTSVPTRQRKVAFQSFLICFFIFLVAGIFALAGFVPVPLSMVKLTTIALQLCSGLP
jgi:Serpentine type 7TM GPCR chemoreceptor Srt